MAFSIPNSLSPSKISSFKDCPLHFRFTVLERLPEPPSAPASKGILVHRALELLMLRPASERCGEAAMADLERARAELASHDNFTGLNLSPAESTAFIADAARLVRRYLHLEDPTQVRPVGLELRLTASLGPVRLVGIIDRLEIDPDGELVVTDYKTGAVPGERQEQARMTGVHFYALLCERQLGRRPARVQLYYLSRPEAIIARPSDQSTSGTERRALALWAAVERACEQEDFRPRPGPLCEWCSFRPYCPSWGGEPDRAEELKATL